MPEAPATTPASPAFQKLVAKLREVFQIDQPDLDFGIYRIINARAAEIGDYLENKLRAKVDAALASGQQAGVEELKRELAAAEQQARDLGADPSTLPKVKDLRSRIAAQSGAAAEHRDAVFSHLLAFFSRYYDRGDFISQRRYKGDTYAIPYSGEEVVLHWANKDQYYTKSGENFTNYTFSLADGRRVHFRLAAADTAKDDRKDTDLERRFRLIEPRTATRLGDEGEEVQEAPDALPLKMRPLAFDGDSEVRFVRDLEAFYRSEAGKKAVGSRSLYLLRNAATKDKGIGFATAGNFYPDFLLWLVDDTTGKQWLSFVDPKGIRNVDLDHPKLRLYREIKNVEKQLNDPSLTLNAFILSGTPFNDILNLGGKVTQADLEARNVLFMDTGKDAYLSALMAAVS